MTETEQPNQAAAKHLMRRASQLAFTVQTGTRQEINQAIREIPSWERAGLLAVLAAMVDIDTVPRTRRITRTDAIHLAAAGIQANHDLWVAYQYGDRDPDVVRGHHLYADYLAEHAGVTTLESRVAA